MYLVKVSKRAEKAILKFPLTDETRMSLAIASPEENPRPVSCRKLSSGDHWRLRVGDYRILYDIFDAVQIVDVVDVGNRKHIYR